MPCTGRVSPLHLLSALAEGADGVMVAGCLLGQCHYREGNFNAVDRVAFVQRLLKSVGVEPERCRMFTMSAGEPPKFVAAVREMDRVISGLPPLPRSSRRRPVGTARRDEGGRLMPLTHRGREILSRVPGGTLQSTVGVGCEIVRHEELCVGCGTCAKNCPQRRLRARRLLRREPAAGRAGRQPPRRARRARCGALMQHEPDGPVEVPERVTVYRTIIYDDEKCLGCGTCARGCPAEAIEARPPQADAAPTPAVRAPARGGARMTSSNGNGPTRPLVLLCECAGTLKNIDFDRLEQHAGLHADVHPRHPLVQPRRPGAAARADGGRASGRQLVFAGCSADFAARRFQKLLARGLQLEIADIREGCSWVHGDDVDAVTDKAARIIDSSIAYPDAPADTMSYAERHDTVVVIGGGVAGTQAAAELAQMGHHVELVERRPFLGGRAARIGTVFPTNDCGQCLPTTDAQAGTRKCFHRNVAIDHPDLTIRRRSTVEAVTGHPGDFQVSIRTPAQHRHRRLHQLRHLRDGVRGRVLRARQEGHLHRVLRRPRDPHRRPRDLHLLRQVRRGVPGRGDRLRAVAASAPRSTPAPSSRPPAASRRPHEATSTTSATGTTASSPRSSSRRCSTTGRRQASLGRMPVEELVMIQCAGSRDQRHLPHCSRLCCMIALKHAIRLKTLFPEMKVTICYLEMRTAGVGYENWFLDARQAGVEFLRGTPPEVQFDAAGRPVIEVEDVTAARKRVLRPDLVVLSTGMVPADGDRAARPDARHRPRQRRLHRDPRPQEPRHRDQRRGHLRLRLRRRPQGAHRGQHRGLRGGQRDPQLPHLGRAPRHGAVAGRRRPVRGLRHLHRPCAPSAPSRWWTGRRARRGRPRSRMTASSPSSTPETCRACGICAANCPEVAIAHNLSDDALFGRIATHDRRASRSRSSASTARSAPAPPSASAASTATTTPRACGSSSCPAWAG